MKLVLFDLDHTLLDGDSDVLWCQFLIDQGLLDRDSSGAQNAAMERGYRAGTVSARAFAGFYVSTMAGRSAAQWQPLITAFVQHRVWPRISAAARALVREALHSQALVVLTTATNSTITAPTAQWLGMQHLIGTDCEVGADGVLSGRISGEPNMLAGKVLRLRAWLAARGQRLQDFESWAYSDSANDLPLLRAVQHAVAVHPDPRLAAEAARLGWPVLQLHGSAMQAHGTLKPETPT